jgi:hypothetical protein
LCIPRAAEGTRSAEPSFRHAQVAGLANHSRKPERAWRSFAVANSRFPSARRSRPARAATRQRLEMLEKRIRRAGGAFVHSTRELSASAYGFLVELQPSRAPCSTRDDYLTPTALLHWEGAAAGPASPHDMAAISSAIRGKRAQPLSGADAVRTRCRAEARAETRSNIPYPWRRGVSAQLGARSATVLAALLLVAGCGGAKADEETIALARQAYAKAKARAVEMSRGPCLGVIRKAGWPTWRTTLGERSTTGRKTSARPTARGTATTSSSSTPRETIARDELSVRRGANRWCA